MLPCEESENAVDLPGSKALEEGEINDGSGSGRNSNVSDRNSLSQEELSASAAKDNASLTGSTASTSAGLLAAMSLGPQDPGLNSSAVSGTRPNEQV